MMVQSNHLLRQVLMVLCMERMCCYTCSGLKKYSHVGYNWQFLFATEIHTRSGWRLQLLPGTPVEATSSPSAITMATWQLWRIYCRVPPKRWRHLG